MNRKLLTALLALCAALCLLPALALAEGAADVAIDPTNFPDANFLAYVGSFDTDNDKLLSPAELTKVKEMTLINKSIGDLTGIEHFTALTKLTCRWNPLTSLDVSQNTALQVLNCNNNQLTSLVLGGNTDLTKLDCCWNQLTSLDVSKNTALEELDCGDNQLTSLDVSANTALKQLYCMNNPLTALDVSKNTSLTDLNCINTQRASLDVSKNTALTSLLCGENLLTSLDVSANTALTSLRCAKNQLASLDVSKNTALEDLDFRWNQLTSLDVSANTALKDLDCRWNQLTSLDLSANPKLSLSHCSTNNNTYRLTLDESRTLDLTTLPGSFDVTKASYWSGGTVVGTVLTVDGGAEQVTYSYDCGDGITADFTLTCDKARYTVTFGNDRAPAQTVTHGEKAVEPPKPTSPGHIFKAWYAGNEPYDFDTPVTQDLHLEDWWNICNHSGSTEKSTCTATAVCTVCGGTIRALKHLWGAWLPDSGAATHTRTCTRGVPHTETEACADNNKDHTCDTCGKVLTQCADGNSDHACDLCGKVLTQCADTDKDHKCDYCGATLSQCADADKDHKCDYCGKTLSQCADADKDHKCDYCGATLSQCADTDKDHKCDYCGAALSQCADADKDHKCDYCGKVLTQCADGNNDHACDLCGKVLTVHTGGRATCTAPASCAICGQPYGEKDAAAHAALNHVPARAATTEAEGNIEYWHCAGCDTYYRDAAAKTPITLADTVTPRRIPHRYSGPSISVLETSYYDGGRTGLTFISSASFDSFKGVQVDGKTLAARNYIAGRGSIEVYLKPAYLRTLTNGDHIVTILSAEGDVSAVFAVSVTAGSVTGGKTSPSTFDPGVTAYAAAALVSLTGLTLLRRKRRKED